jgi:endonuclease/exonuclease/phosphatase family metal-dependent hydrolase
MSRNDAGVRSVPPRRLRLASYNIHQCVGGDGRRDPGRVADVLRELGADVIGLQEVDARPGLATDSVQMEYLAHALGLRAISGPTIHRHDGHYGNALLTRRPVLDVRHIDLTVYRREPRGAIDVDLDVDGAVVRFIVTHLGLLPGERRAQVRRLMDVLGDRHRQLVILCGDINEWFAVGRPLRWLHGRLGRSPTLATFPAAFPVFALDRIWVRPHNAVVRVGVHATATARAASDHLPLAAEIEIGPT